MVFQIRLRAISYTCTLYHGCAKAEMILSTLHHIISPTRPHALLPTPTATTFDDPHSMNHTPNTDFRLCRVERNIH